MPHIEQLRNAFLADMTSRIWVMEPRALEEYFRRLYAPLDVGTVNMEQIIAAKKEGVTRESKLVIDGGTAIISITGFLMKEVPCIFRIFGIDATSYADIRMDIADALESEAVERIVLKIDSPGGEVAGVQEAADAIFSARTQKPINTFIEDLGASGAYWLASQGQSITANENAIVGSIGVYGVYHDSSEMAGKLGIKVHVIRSGEHKGMGVAGAEITDSQVQAVQKIIDDIAVNFASAIARGRGMERAEVKELATGQAWLAGKAKKNGLIDQVAMLKDALSGWAVSEIKSLEGGNVVVEKDQEKEVKVEVVDETALKAEVAEGVRSEDAKRLAGLKAEFAEEPDFILEQYSKGATVEAAKAAYSDVLKTRLEETEKEKAELEKKLAGKTAEEGAEGVDSQESVAEGGETDFVKAAIALAEEKGITKTAAMQKLAAENPEMFDTWKAGQKRVPKK